MNFNYSSPDKTIILAGTQKEFMDFICELGINPESAIYINTKQKIVLIGKDKMYYEVGTSEDRSDYKMLKEELDKRGHKKMMHSEVIEQLIKC